MHEEFDREEEVKGSSDRSFGFVLAAFLFLVAFGPLLHLHPPRGEIRWWALAGAITAFALALFWTGPLAPLNRLWLKLGLLLYRIVNPIVLGLLFYATVTPIGLLMRALGKDPLRLRLDREATSYWIRREPPGPTADSMKNQF